MDILTTAKNIADRVEAESLKQDVPVAVTVIDSHGNVVLTHRMTGAGRSPAPARGANRARTPAIGG